MDAVAEHGNGPRDAFAQADQGDHPMPTAPTPRYPDLDACAYQELGRFTVPGAAIAVLHDGEVARHAYGVANLETKQPVTPETLFQIGSISKIFTATIAMQLVDEGTLDLDAPVASYLPDLRLGDAAAQRSVTLRHLLSHTSGIEGDRFDDYGSGDDALAKAIAEFPTLRQLSPPGKLWTYCNSGFNLAGAVIEQLTEKPFESAMRQRLLDPLGLGRSFYFAHEAIAYPVAVGHSQEPGHAPTVARHYPLPRAVNAAGGIIGTVGDLLRFAAFHLADGLFDGERRLSEASARAMRQAQTPAANFADRYGLGWALRGAGGALVVGHGGTTNGFQAQLTLVPERAFALAILTNGARGASAIRSIERWLIDEHCGLTLDEAPSTTLPPHRLARFAGSYQQPNASVTVAAVDDHLRIDVVTKSPLTRKETVLPTMTAAPIGEHEFVVTEGDSAGSRLDFLPATDDPPRRIRLGGRLADRAAPDPVAG